MKIQMGLLLALCSAAAQAQLLVPAGAKGTLSVQYSYMEIGAKKDKYDPKEWHVQRSISLVAQMTADKQQPLSVMRPMEKEQAADLQNKQAAAQSLTKKQEPVMADMMKIMEKCGENEDCISKAVAAYGLTMDPSKVNNVKDEAAALGKQGGPRYQLWKPVSQSGKYSVDEWYRGATADPLCLVKPQQRCHREETRKGGGEVPAPPNGKNVSVAMFEVDSQKKDILVTLPVPLNVLRYTRTVKSDFPDEASGSSEGVLTNLLGKLKPMTFAIPADLRSVNGTQSIKLDGAEGEGGTLVVKWQFTQP